MSRCYSCRRELSNPESVKIGIGPVCRAKRKREENAQEKLDREVSKCHFGFNCYDPEHVGTLVQRLLGTMGSWPEWLAIEHQRYGDEADVVSYREISTRITGLAMMTILDMLDATGHHRNPVNEIAPHTYRIPADLSEQYRYMILRERRICPHGLDCKNPGAAVAAIYSILSILRNEVEPLFANTSYGGLVAASDRAYVACANMLQVLGLDDEGSHIINIDIPKMQKAATRNARRWARKMRRREVA